MTLTVPELTPELRELKERVRRFVEEEGYPVEARVAQRGSIDPDETGALRRKARAAGFSQLNMPRELGGQELSMVGQVAIEEESGKLTNGLGFAVVDRGPAELYELLTPEQRDRFMGPILRGEHREAWAVTEPGAGSDVSALSATAVRDGDDWVLNGEKWFVTCEGDPGFYIVLAVHEGEQLLFLVEPDTPGLDVKRVPGFLHDPYLDHHPEIVLSDCRVPDANRVPASGNEGAKEWFLVERLFIAARCCGAAERSLAIAREFALEREAFGSRIAEFQGSRSRSPTRWRSFSRRASSRTMRRTPSTRSRTARSSTGRCRSRSSTHPRRRAASSTGRCRCSAAAATGSTAPSRASTARSVSIASGKGRARSSA